MQSPAGLWRALSETTVEEGGGGAGSVRSQLIAPLQACVCGGRDHGKTHRPFTLEHRAILRTHILVLEEVPALFLGVEAGDVADGLP